MFCPSFLLLQTLFIFFVENSLDSCVLDFCSFFKTLDSCYFFKTLGSLSISFKTAKEARFAAAKIIIEIRPEIHGSTANIYAVYMRAPTSRWQYLCRHMNLKTLSHMEACDSHDSTFDNHVEFVYKGINIISDKHLRNADTVAGIIVIIWMRSWMLFRTCQCWWWWR